ncbi:hypothetical protein PBI_PAEDORE_69 [Streptomyces phage Paedore]|uniref:Uncharacterized protein n=1 Tax=Streptomyces phage Paedore TaxID=2108134 RepID=A0A2P1JTV0_9CAUD|nr:hypothetical protein KGG91_gp69 [Streptomyces phage Paedore]AVO22552.1 hypothetical protein PBI_PAEDORE_69 [Streptomyces phage Paedore]
MSFKIGERQNEDTYRMRSVAGGYPGDIVRGFTRVINGTEYAFSRIEWGNGAVTVGAMKKGETEHAHYFESKPN